MKGFAFEPLTPFRYGGLIIDFPLKYINWGDELSEKSPDAHYATMTKAQLLKLPSPLRMLAARDCLAMVWSTWPHVPLVMQVMRAAGYSYSTGGSWTKTTRLGKRCFGTGRVVRGTTEPFLFFTMGDPKIGSKSVRNVIETTEWIEDEAELPSLIESERREHSRKPPEARAIMEQLRPGVYQAELFARESWPGHEVWGWESGKFDEVAA